MFELKTSDERGTPDYRDSLDWTMQPQPNTGHDSQGLIVLIIWGTGPRGGHSHMEVMGMCGHDSQSRGLSVTN